MSRDDTARLHGPARPGSMAGQGGVARLPLTPVGLQEPLAHSGSQATPTPYIPQPNTSLMWASKEHPAWLPDTLEITHPGSWDSPGLF